MRKTSLGKKLKSNCGLKPKYLIFFGVFVFLASLPLMPPAISLREAQQMELSEPPMNGTIVYASDGSPITSFLMTRGRDITIKQVPTIVQRAVIAVEDERFYQHQGIDLKSIGRALIKNVKEGRIVQGGSTITQQYVKNVYLSETKSFDRKIKELVLARRIEKKYSKKKILELYLNSIYFGSSAYGLEAAAYTYFGHEGEDLNLPETALLVSILKSPSDFSFLQNPRAAQERSYLVLKKLRKQDFISEKQETKARQEIERILTPLLSSQSSDDGAIKGSNRVISTHFPIKKGYLYSYTNNWHKDEGGSASSEHQNSPKRKANDGIDISASAGVPLVASVSGIIEGINSLSFKDYGNHLFIRDSKGNRFFYAYVSSFAPGIKNGVPVTSGQEIGIIGKKKPSDVGPILHFEIRTPPYQSKRCSPPKQVTAINPYKSLRAADKQKAFASLFIKFIRLELVKKYGKRPLFTRGLSVRTSLRPDVQQKVESMGKRLNKGTDSNAAIMVIDPVSSHMLGLSGSENFPVQKLPQLAKELRYKGLSGFSLPRAGGTLRTAEIKLPGQPQDWKVEYFKKSGQTELYIVSGPQSHKTLTNVPKTATRYPDSKGKGTPFSLAEIVTEKSSAPGWVTSSWTSVAAAQKNSMSSVPVSILNVTDKNFRILEKNAEIKSRSFPPRKVEDNEVYLVINLDTNMEYVYLGNPNKRTVNKLLEVHPVATGMRNQGFWFQTPAAKWAIYGKTVSSREYGPRILPLYRWDGDKFVRVNAYALHGTNDEPTIGQYVSHGCIRHYNDTIKHLYDFLPEGTIVWTIRGEKTDPYSTPGSNFVFSTDRSERSFASSGAQITFSFDDGYKNVYDLGMPILAPKNIPGVIYPITGPLERREDWVMNWNQIRELQNAYGWEIGSHGINHQKLTALSPQDLDNELQISKKALESRGLVIKSLATPYGDHNNQVLNLAARYYQSHRTVQGTNNSFPYNDYLVTSKEVSSSVSSEEVKKWIDKAISDQEWLVFLFHNIVEDNPGRLDYKREDLQKIVDYVISTPIRPVTVSEGLEVTEENMVPNYSFEDTASDFASAWTRGNSQYSEIDATGVGNFPNPTKSLRITGNGEQHTISSEAMRIDPEKNYLAGMYLKIQNFKLGGVTIYVNEYNAKKRLIAKRPIGETSGDFVGVKASLYLPSSAEVRYIKLKILTQGELTLFADSIRLAPIK